MRQCLTCGSDISQLTAKAVYCSGACKVKAHRLKDKASGPQLAEGKKKVVVEKVSVIPEISQNETKPDLSDIEFFIGKSGIKYRLSRELLLDLLDRFPEPTKKLQYVSVDNTPMSGMFSISHLREPAYYIKPIESMDDYHQRVGATTADPFAQSVNNVITSGIRYNTISDYQKQYEDLIVANGTSTEFQQLADDINANPLLTPKQKTVLLHQINCIK